VQYLRQLTAGFQLQRPWFDPKSCIVELVVDEVVLEYVYSKYFGFSCQFSFYGLFHTHLSPEAGKVGFLVSKVPSEPSLTPPHGFKNS
jgi:hypothetical protein